MYIYMHIQRKRYIHIYIYTYINIYVCHKTPLDQLPDHDLFVYTNILKGLHAW